MVLSESEMHWRIGNMPERYADRLPERSLKQIVSFRNAGEWKFVVDWLMASLVRHSVTISTRERDELAEILPMLRLPTDELEQLTVIPSLTDQEFEERAQTLVERFRDRVLDPEDLELMEDAQQRQRWRELIMDTVESLYEAKATITPEERDDLWLMLDAVRRPRLELSQLRVI
ncbi:MAG: hypothetical protein ACRDTM_03080 [Micromonosporaceae bacterium]